MDPRLQRSKEQKQGDQPELVVGPDGLQLPPAAQLNINKCVFRVLHGNASEAECQTFMTWLRDLTVNRVHVHTVSEAELRELEGMRRLYSIICIRSELGRTGDVA